MSDKEPPKIEFPCEDYPIKVIGEAHIEMSDFVMTITEQFAPGFNRNKVSMNTSSKGKFQSITLYITATGLDQLQAYHKALMEHSKIKVVL